MGVNPLCCPQSILFPGASLQWPHCAADHLPLRSAPTPAYWSQNLRSPYVRHCSANPAAPLPAGWLCSPGGTLQPPLRRASLIKGGCCTGDFRGLLLLLKFHLNWPSALLPPELQVASASLPCNSLYLPSAHFSCRPLSALGLFFLFYNCFWRAKVPPQQLLSSLAALSVLDVAWDFPCLSSLGYRWLPTPPYFSTVSTSEDANTVQNSITARGPSMHVCPMANKYNIELRVSPHCRWASKRHKK